MKSLVVAVDVTDLDRTSSVRFDKAATRWHLGCIDDIGSRHRPRMAE